MAKNKDTEEMAELYRAGRTMQQIADDRGITKQAVSQRLAAAGIKKRLKSREIDKETIERLYTIERLTVEQIGKHFGTTEEIIRKSLRWHEIPRRLPIKKGGPFVDILRKLEAGASVEIIHEGENPRPTFYNASLRAEIKIRVRAIGKNVFSVTRI